MNRAETWAAVAMPLLVFGAMLSAAAWCHSAPASPTPPPPWAAPWDTLSGPLDVPTVEGALVVHDPVRHRMLALGGSSLGQVWALSLPATGTLVWTEIDVSGPVPGPRPGFSAVYDSLRDRVLLFGGYVPDSAYGDLWALSLDGEPRWTTVATQGDAPPASRVYSVVLDPNRDRLVVFGWRADYEQHLSDLWELNLAGTPTWEPVLAFGRPPYPRGGASMVYDRWYDRIVGFGGWEDDPQPSCPYGGWLWNDTWTLNSTGPPLWWPYYRAPCPAPRFNATTVLDADRHRMIVIGGQTQDCYSHGVLQDAWACQLDSIPTWSPVSATGPVTAGYRGIYSPERNSVICFTGNWAECYELSLEAETWSQILPPIPDTFPVRQSGATFLMARDSGRLLLFGGAGSGDLWSFGLGDTTGWRREAWAGYGPFSTSDMNIYDSRRNRLIAFSGGTFLNRGATIDEVWVLPLDGAHAWTAVAPQGTRPPARALYSAMYDSLRDRVLLFGGLGTLNPTDPGSSRDDLWELSLGETLRWRQLTPTGTPGTRSEQTAVYDAQRDRMLVHGGYQGSAYSYRYKYDTWALSLGDDSLAWSQVNPAAPALGQALFDPLRERLLVLAADMRLWELPLADPSQWRQVPVPGRLPLARSDPGVVYDSERDMLFAFGGYTNWSVFRADLYGLRFSAAQVTLVSAERDSDHVTLVWGGMSLGEPMSVQRSRGDSVWATLATLTADAAGRIEYVDWDLEAGGRYGYRPAVPGADRHYVETWLDVPAGPSMHLFGAVPNPARHILAVSFTLASGGPARIQVFDLAGRRVMERDLGGFSPGAHTLSLRGGLLRPGVYLLRLVQGAQSATARAVVLE